MHLYNLRCIITHHTLLEDGKACQRCTCTRCGSGLSKGLCYIFGNNQNSLNDSSSISENSSQSPLHINHCCCECGDPLDGIFCKRCTYNIISGLPPCSAITPNEPVLSTKEPDNSLSMGDEHLDTILATESDEVIKSSVENLVPIPNSFSIDNIDYVEASPPDSELVSSEVMEIVIPEVGGIDDDILLTIKDDILHEKLLNVNLLIAKIEALNDNPTPSFDCKTKSSSTSLNSLLEETNTFDNSLLEFETFSFDISSGSPTTHSDSSLYASFIFDLSINLFPPADRSDFYEFADELIHFISPPEYDCFLFTIEPNSGDFTMDVVEDISPTKEPKVYNAFPTHPTLQLNIKFQPSSEYLFTYVVWIFLPFLVYSVAPHYLLSLRNEDTIFDPGICKSHSFLTGFISSVWNFQKFNTHRSHLNESPMEILSSTCSPMDQ
uniref:Pre-mRNA splicing Prp18-interacting factor n=1 Tax=Tanacetum cinerariifolium TaxID=118510 RepID=A0A6L2NEX3_TANCI|nr:hypothetical protein [Tanacetum cinerariifolium]